MTSKLEKSIGALIMVIGFVSLFVLLFLPKPQQYVLYTGVNEHWKSEMRYYLEDTNYAQKQQIVLWFNYKGDDVTTIKQVKYRLTGSNLNISGVGALSSQGVFEQGGLDSLNSSLVKNKGEIFLVIEWNGKEEKLRLERK